jgi:hypothetical protein
MDLRLRCILEKGLCIWSRFEKTEPKTRALSFFRNKNMDYNEELGLQIYIFKGGVLNGREDYCGRRSPD